MPEDFTALPTSAWFDLSETQRAHGWLLAAVVCVMILLIWTLVSKGVLSSWTELFTVPRANG
jgi:hypothetical protein